VRRGSPAALPLRLRRSSCAGVILPTAASELHHSIRSCTHTHTSPRTQPSPRSYVHRRSQKPPILRSARPSVSALPAFSFAPAVASVAPSRRLAAHLLAASRASSVCGLSAVVAAAAVAPPRGAALRCWGRPLGDSVLLRRTRLPTSAAVGVAQDQLRNGRASVASTHAAIRSHSLVPELRNRAPL